MKKILFIASLLLGFATFSFAQAPPPMPQDTSKNKMPKATPEQRATDVACHLIKDLNLTWAQATKIHDADLIRETKLDALKAKPLADKAANDAAGKQIDADYDAAVKAILTADQYQKFQTRRQLDIQKRELKRKEDSINGKH